jgi:hypothetical protein
MMVFKLMESASTTWRLLNGSPLLAKVIGGVRFVDGVEQAEAARFNRHPQHLTIAPPWTSVRLFFVFKHAVGETL